MSTWVALLRAVNLGRTNKVPMAGLRALLEGLGYGDVRTHLTSGNAVFTAPGRAAAIENAIREALHESHGLDTAVMVRSLNELDAVIAANPYASADPKLLHVVFLAGRPKPAKIDREKYDDFEIGDRVVYVRLPNGVQGMRLPAWDKVLGVPATMRTWNTVNTLRDKARTSGRKPGSTARRNPH